MPARSLEQSIPNACEDLPPNSTTLPPINLTCPIVARLATGAGNGVAHVGVGLYIAQVVILHHAHASFAESIRQSQRHLGFRFDHFSSVLFYAGAHFLFESDCGSSALLGV